MLTYQTQEAINYQRRRSILGAITKSDNKATVKDEYAEEVKNTESMLLGKQFQKVWEKEQIGS